MKDKYKEFEFIPFVMWNKSFQVPSDTIKIEKTTIENTMTINKEQ